jgi:hypothetical protein
MFGRNGKREDRGTGTALAPSPRFRLRAVQEQDSRLPGKKFSQNTIDLQWKMRANYNVSPCAGEEKTAGAGTMANNGKNNAQNNGKQSDLRARLTPGYERSTSSDVVACGPWRPNEKRPPTRAGDNSHKSETRISAIADFARECKGKKKRSGYPCGARLRRAVAQGNGM